MDSFSVPVRRWFDDAFAAPTRVQELGWPVLTRGRNALLVAPTGSGKTLAAFLWAIDRLSFGAGGGEPGCGGERGSDGVANGGGEVRAPEPGVRVLYVSPLKALVHDIERNLQAPLAGVRKAARKLGRPVRPITVDVRTGDTTPHERRRQLRRPGEILVTTPESLFLILGSRAAANLRTVETVIVDEVHAMAATKRGAHLALSLERLAELTGDRAPQRIGLSATVRPMTLAAEFLGGDRPVEIVDASEPPHIDIEVVVPVADMEAPPPARALGDGDEPPPGSETAGLWPSVYPRILEAVKSHRSTIVFVNSRSLCERLARRLNDLAVGVDGDADGDAEDALPLVRAHHGSISHEQRREIEESLKAGRLRCIVATSSLELGIDMGSVDLVLMVEAPGSAVRGLQRVGRAGHAVGERSRGLMFPKFRGDLLECTVTAIQMERGAIESMRLPENPLDVLAQQIVAMCCDRERTIEDLLNVVRRARPYRGLTRGVLTTVLDMLVGRYPSEEFADLRPRLSWDHGRGVLTARRGAALLVRMNAGTIPDRGLFTVHLGPEGPRLGELDEEMVYESRAGDTFLLGAAAWRVTEITRDRVIVRPAPGEPGRMPFWHGDGPGRPVELGEAPRCVSARTRPPRRRRRPALPGRGAPLKALVGRFARSRGPFASGDAAGRFGLPQGAVEPVLEALEDAGSLVRGEYRSGGAGFEWCDREVLRQIKRRTLAKLRREAAPVDGAALARFLGRWQGVDAAAAVPTRPASGDGAAAVVPRHDPVASAGAAGRPRRGRAVASAPSDGALVRLREAVAQLEGVPLSWRTLVGHVLPARVPGFRVDMLDRLAAAGELLWVGSGRLGSKDGRVAIYRRQKFRVLARESGSSEAAAEWPARAPHAAILERLEARGACFTFDLVGGVAGDGDWGETEVEAAIRDLVWAGRMTNDTFLPLAALGRRRRSTAGGVPRGLPRGWRRGPRAGTAPAGTRSGTAPAGVRSGVPGARRGRAGMLAGGRWSLVGDLAAPDGPVSDTEWAHATATMLLDRHGVVAAETARHEHVPGGFEVLYPVLREMEEAGHIRRGYFVDGLAGRQFAVPAAVERLRRERRGPAERGPIEVLPAVDPASPWGAVLSWPRLGSEIDPRRRGPRRVPGAWLVLRAGSPRLYLEAGGQGVRTFAALGDDPEPGDVWGALRDLAGRRRRRTLRLLRIDGRPAREAPWTATLDDCGFEKDPDGYRVSRRLPAVS